MQLHFAPLQGYADTHYRRIHADVYGSADTYYTPFIRVENGEPRHQDMRRLGTAELPENQCLIPQVIFNSDIEFRILTEAVKTLGYKRIDLNMGCPHPMQTRKGRGTAVIANPTLLQQIADIVNDDTETVYSVKLRLGMVSPDEWQRALPVINGMRLAHVTVHPRTAKQMYNGDLSTEQFDIFYQQSTNPVVWNGEIHTPDDIDRIVDRYPNLAGVMIGRGMLARPSLMTEWREHQQWSDEQRLSRILDMHQQLLEAYQSTLCGDTQILQHIKAFWEYLEPEIGHKAYKAIRKAGSMSKYLAAINF